MDIFRRKHGDGSLLTEFGESLLLIVDPEQLKSNLLSKLKELINVEKAFVYLADQSSTPRVFRCVDSVTSTYAYLPELVINGKLVSWFCINRQMLVLHENKDITQYLAEELAPFLQLSVNLVFPLLSMDRLIGIVFLHLPKGIPSKEDFGKIQALGRQAGLAFENALLFKERLRQNERMFRAEQLAIMGQFAAGIAHELRNPLTAIRSTVQYLSGEVEKDDEAKKLAEDVLGEIDRLNGIVENLLTLARPAESKPQQLDIREEIKHYLHFVEAQAKKQNITIKCQFQNDLPDIFCDPAELRQVIINLILNSMQAMLDGGIITIKAFQYLAEKNNLSSQKKQILVEVEDTGSGMSPDLKNRVFEPFFTTKSGGTGLGLTICNNIIRSYNSDIWIDQSDNNGTVIKFTLPSV